MILDVKQLNLELTKEEALWLIQSLAIMVSDRNKGGSQRVIVRTHPLTVEDGVWKNNASPDLIGKPRYLAGKLTLVMGE